VRRLSVGTLNVSPYTLEPWTAIGNEWSSVNAINSNNTKVLLKTSGPTGLFSINGGGVTWLNYAFPSVATVTTYRWSHTNPNLLYFVDPDNAYYSGPDVGGPSAIKSLDVSTGAVTVLRTFPQYAALSFTAEDLSPDGDYMPILANGRYSFWYRISTDTVGPVIDRVALYGYTVGEKGSQYMLGEVFVMANFHKQPNGLMVFAAQTMALKFVTTEIDHRAFGLDVDGTPIAIMPGSASNHGCDPLTTYAIVKWNLRDGTATKLLCSAVRAQTDYYYSLPQPSRGWLAVTHVMDQYDPLPPDWIPFQSEIFLLKLDGSGTVRRLAHHRNRPSIIANPPLLPYGARAKPTISLDGSKIVFGSNMGLVNPTPTGSTDYQDAYLLDISGIISGPPTPLSAPTNLAVY
jgi:hypothetical protein